MKKNSSSDPSLFLLHTIGPLTIYRFSIENSEWFNKCYDYSVSRSSEANNKQTNKTGESAILSNHKSLTIHSTTNDLRIVLLFGLWLSRSWLTVTMSKRP